MTAPYRFSLLTALGLVAALAGGCSLLNPEPVNESHQGELAAGDTVVETDGSFADDYTIRVQEGWKITAVMSSEAFNPYVWVIPPDWNNASPPPQQGSQPGTHVATIEHIATKSGTFTVRANSNTGGESGAYTLTINAGPNTAAAAPAQ